MSSTLSLISSVDVSHPVQALHQRLEVSFPAYSVIEDTADWTSSQPGSRGLAVTASLRGVLLQL